jgi:hypothetical protein
MPLRPQPVAEVIEQRFQQAGEHDRRVGLAAKYLIHQPLDRGVSRRHEGDDDAL